MYVYYNRKEKRGVKTFFTIVLTVIITIATMKFVPKIVSGSNNETSKNDVQRLTQRQEFTEVDEIEIKEKNFIDIIEENMSSVVGVSVLKPDGDGILDFDVAEKWGIGTGIIISEKGYILTNQHLASNLNSTVTVTLDNETEIKGKTIWNEPNLDLAIIKIDSTRNLKKVKLGDANTSQIGEEVIAIGNPLGLEFQKSVTKGVISGLNRTLKVEDEISTVVMENLIQTDASINTGNSGGPLINKQGEVIGVNTVKITSAEGIGFAVPIGVIKPILNKLEKNERFDEGYLGIFAYDSEIVPYLNENIETNSGIYVATVTKGGPASKAGIEIGDIILKVDGVEINKMIELREYIYGKAPGDKITLNILRNNEILSLDVILDKK